MVREPGAAGREDPRRPKATRTLLGEDVERPPPAFLCPHPVPGKRGPPTCHLGGSRSQAQRTAWAPERAGDRRAGTPGGCRNCSPGARSIGWGGRQRLAPTGWPAGIDTHPHPAQARAYTHTHTNTRTHSHKARLLPGSAMPGRPLAAEGTRRPQALRSEGTVCPRRARAFTCARRRLASGSRRPQAGLRLRGQSPQPPPRGPPSPALRPPLGRRPERGRPLRPPRRGPERGREAGKGSAAGGGTLAARHPGGLRRGTGASRLGERLPPLRPECSGFGALAGAAGEGAPREGHGSRADAGRLLPPPPSFLLAPRSTSQQVLHLPTPSPWLIPLPGATPPEPRPSALLLPHLVGLPAPSAGRGRKVAQASHSSSSQRPPPGENPPAARDPLASNSSSPPRTRSRAHL